MLFRSDLDIGVHVQAFSTKLALLVTALTSDGKVEVSSISSAALAALVAELGSYATRRSCSPVWTPSILPATRC